MQSSRVSTYNASYISNASASEESIPAGGRHFSNDNTEKWSPIICQQAKILYTAWRYMLDFDCRRIRAAATPRHAIFALISCLRGYAAILDSEDTFVYKTRDFRFVNAHVSPAHKAAGASLARPTKAQLIDCHLYLFHYHARMHAYRNRHFTQHTISKSISPHHRARCQKSYAMPLIILYIECLLQFITLRQYYCYSHFYYDAAK